MQEQETYEEIKSRGRLCNKHRNAHWKSLSMDRISTDLELGVFDTLLFTTKFTIQNLITKYVVIYCSFMLF